MKNKSLAIRAIKSDCMISGLHMDDEGNTCAIGMLALKAGVAKRTVQRASGSILANPPLYRAIEKKFGLSVDQQSDVQRLNDMWSTPAPRRKSILAYLKTL